MIEILIEFKLAIIILLMVGGGVIFRKELNKLLDWVVTFKKMAGSKGDYKLSLETEKP